MPTAYTSLLGLALPVTGELQGTWGTTVNDAITSLLDTAVAGTTTLSTDADVTLTTTTGASNQARQAIILWTANGSVTRNITAPAQSKTYVVINASAGTQSIVIRGVGPTTGVTVLKGERVVVAWNGSDFVKVGGFGGAGTFTDLTVTGNTTLGDASTDTVQVNGYMGVGGAASSARGLLVTGSTMTGSTQIGLDSSITGSATGTSLIAAVNGTPTTAAAAFTVTDLIGLRAGDVAKGAGSTITNKHGVYIVDQTQGTNNYGITSVVSSGTNKWNIYASGTAANYFGGRVLLGDTDGSVYDTNAGSDVGGYYPTKITGGTGGVSAGVVIGAGSNGTVGFYKGNTAGKDVVTSVVNGQTQVTTAGAEDGRLLFKVMRSGTLQDRLAFYESEAVFNDPGNDYDFRVESDTNTHALFVQGSDGNVGIGTSTPNRGNYIPSAAICTTESAVGGVFEVSSTQALTNGKALGVIGFANAASGVTGRGSAFILGLQDGTNATSPGGALTFSTRPDGGSATERLRIDSSGNLGLGVTPSAWGAPALQLPNGVGLFSYASTPTLNLGQNVYAAAASGTNRYIATAAASLYQQQAGTHIWLSAPSGTAGNAITFTQAMTLDASGGLLVGFTSNTNYGLTTNHAIAASAGLLVSTGATSGTATALYVGNGGNQAADRGTAISLVSSGTGLGVSGSRTTGRIISASSFAGTQGGYLRFDTENTSGTLTERMRIDSSGNLGLGVTPSAWNASIKAIDIAVGGSVLADTSGIAFAQNAYFDSGWKYRSSGVAAGRLSSTVGQHLFFTAPSGTAGAAITFTEKVRIDADGLKFNGDTAAANALDDYEEGTFTPTIVGTTTAGTGTYQAQVGRYTKIGNRVYFNVYIVWNAHTGTGNMRIGALPFTANATTNNLFALSTWSSAIAMTAGNYMQSLVQNNTTQVYLQQVPTGGGTSVDIPIDTAGSLMIAGHYEV